VVEGGAAREPRADRTHPVGPTAWGRPVRRV